MRLICLWQYMYVIVICFPFRIMQNWTTSFAFLSFCLYKKYYSFKKNKEKHVGFFFVFFPSQFLIIQSTLVISTPLISILSLMSNWFLSPDYFPYVFIVFQLRVCRTTFMSTLRLSRPSFSVPEPIFHSFYYRVSQTRTMTMENKM